MEKEHTSLTKTCSICGNIKPLAAFLQMSSTSGTEYGAVCSDCRKKGADKPKVPESDETTRTSTGVALDNKNKLEIELTKHEEHEQIKEEYYDEREAVGEEQKEEQDKIEQKNTQEKIVRQTFLDRTVTAPKKTDPASESRWRVEQTVKQANNTETATHKETAVKEDLREKGVDQTSTEDLRQGLKEKHKGVAFKQGVAFQSFASRLGKSSTFTQSNTPQDPKVADSIADTIEKNWGPGRKK